LSQLTHHYDNFTVTLYPFVCTPGPEQITLHEHAALVWLPPGELHTLDWLEADRPVLEAYIQNQSLQTSSYQERLQSFPPDKGGLRGVASAPRTFLTYDKPLTQRARENRKNPTQAETRIWCQVLRMRTFENYKFLRQKPIGGYIVDFYCSALRLVIEIDGDSHAENVDYDAVRTKELEALGLSVVRYTNQEVMHNLEAVYEDLCRVVQSLQGVGR